MAKEEDAFEGIEEVHYQSAKNVKTMSERDKKNPLNQVEEIGYQRLQHPEPRKPSSHVEFVEGVKEASGIDKFKANARGAGQAVGEFGRNFFGAAADEVGINSQSVRPSELGRNIGGGAVRGVKGIARATGGVIRSTASFIGRQAEAELEARRAARANHLQSGQGHIESRSERRGFRVAQSQEKRSEANYSLLAGSNTNNYNLTPGANPLSVINPNYASAAANPNSIVVPGNQIRGPQQPQILSGQSNALSLFGHPNSNQGHFVAPAHHNFGMSLFNAAKKVIVRKIAQKRKMGKHKRKR
jgi:hypothetical protein